ncbi:Hsp70 family protein [Pseudonocardia broussonetiae]|uniref:Hsp70 family protein n=1 Tax=Pseudonocardia broussonetiae TaxID=2736640 RepID=A0A6M6JJ86_9PSEU|nr:Hsp70 family protein [Pseudonocardia broussonetiae]QJY46987.1 Hsp70 family protein [Pseudonocardia broussonetiae]
MTYLLGIDLGTTRTSAAVGHPGARPGEIEIVNLGDRSSSIPSVFYAGTDGSVLVGEAAERRALTDPARVVREFKRRIGDPTPLVVAGVPWSPQELSARVVRWVVDRVGEREGGPAARIAVTHPASWGPLKKELLGGALAGQGMQVSFLAEPQAAALHYASAERLESGSTIAVYDLGGGTFDAAVVHKGPQGFGTVGRPEGIERLGGVDFDQVVFDHVRAAMPEAFAGLDDTDPSVLSAVAAVRRECSEAKEALSSDTEVSIPVLLPGSQGSVRLHRSEFEAMIRPQLEDTVSALRRAVASAGMTPDQLTAVLLVGGSSRIPLVAQLVSEQLGRPVAVDADPKNAIAMGAALSLDPAALAGTGPHVPAPRGGSSAPVGARPAGSRSTGSQWAAGPGGAVAAAGLGVAGLGVAAGAGMASAGPSAGPVASAGFRPPGVPPQRVAGERATQVVPPQRPMPGSPGSGQMSAYPVRPPMDLEVTEYREDDYDRPEPPRRRGGAFLVSVGGLAAALGVVATVFLMPSPTPTPTANTDPASTVPVLPPVSSEVLGTPTPVESTEAPVDDDRPAPAAPTRRPDPTTAPPTTQVEPPPPVTTEPPPPTTEPTTPPTTTPPTSSVVEPPPQADAQRNLPVA